MEYQINNSSEVDNWKEVMKKVASDRDNPSAQSRIAGGQHNTIGYAPTMARRTGT